MGKSIATRTGIAPGAGSLIGQAVGAVLLSLRQVIIAIEHRRQLGNLVDPAWTDHRLADIGITRDDLHTALSEPLWRDPTVALARRVGKPGRPRAPPRRSPLRKSSRY